MSTTLTPRLNDVPRGDRFSFVERVAVYVASRIGLATTSLTPILHPSPPRLRWLGGLTFVGHLLFGWIWGVWLIQPYENFYLRGVMASLGLLLMTDTVSRDPTRRLSVLIFTLVFWVQLPVFFSWMYLCNDGNPVWLASYCAMVLISYHVTDWRVATAGVVSGTAVGWVLFELVDPAAGAMLDKTFPVNFVVIGFCWASALVLGISSANRRQEQLQNTLATIGIMAHELRTPLATMALVGDALRGEARTHAGSESEARLDKLAQRMHALVRNMNHQIDLQIANARPGHRNAQREQVSAADVVREVVHTYPYRSARERENVVLRVRRDFLFTGSRELFLQVIVNLVKNALKALATNGTPMQAGQLSIEVHVERGRGHIVVADQGPGIEPHLRARIFEPFFSTDRSTRHGLGLAFCKRVVQGAGGTIRVQSEPGAGAAFLIDLPLTRTPVQQNSSLFTEP